MDEGGHASAVTPEFEPDAQHVSRRFVGLVKARDVRLTGSAAGFVAAAGDLSVLNGGCGPVLTGGSITIRNGGCGPVIAKGDASIENGGMQAILAAGGATIGRKAFVGVVASPKVTIEQGWASVAEFADVSRRGSRHRVRGRFALSSDAKVDLG